ncbi:MAG: hypothetical protein ACI935_001030 [Moritella dasanensis]|jgi:hypothetical protein
MRNFGHIKPVVLSVKAHHSEKLVSNINLYKNAYQECFKRDRKIALKNNI